MSDMPDSNSSWKSRYFFIQGMDWVCCLEEWVTMPHDFDNTWGIVTDLGFSFDSFYLFITCQPLLLLFLFEVL